jgi:phytoene dehydrogenase-like protein
MTDFDAIVIGAGHNGLAAANVLAQRGLRVACLEKTNWPGGQAATKELFDGFKHSVGAWALLVFRDEMLAKLGIDPNELEVIVPRTSYCVFGAPEDKPFVGYTNPAELVQHLMQDHGPDAVQGLAALAEYLAPFKALFDANRFHAPEPIESVIANAPDEKTREALATVFHGSAMDVLRRFFPDPSRHRCIAGSLTASAIDGTHMGPYTPGSALSLAYHYTAGDRYDFRIPKGGIGQLSSLLVRAFEKNGGEIRYKSIVKRLLIEGGRVAGVELTSGERITAKVVLSSLDANATFLRLLGEEHLPAPFVHAVKEIDYRNGYIQLHLTLKELPEFTGPLAFANEGGIRWIMSYIASPDHLSRCWEQYRAGTVPDDPVSYCYLPSMVDPSLAPAGYHSCTIFSHYFPENIPDDRHNEAKKLMADRVIDQIAKRAPNFRGAILDQVVLTHQYFEKTFGATKGDFCQGLLHPGQMWSRRPVPGWSGGYRTPVEGLYMCGAACHPGPGVTCIPGYNGAQEVLRTWQG